MRLSQKAEAQLKRDHNRRSSSVSQANSTYNIVERKAKLLAQQGVLQNELERAEENAAKLEAKASDVREAAKAAQAEQTKALSASITMGKLLLQLQERRANLLQQREALFEEDASERAKMSDQLQAHIAERSSRDTAADPGIAECNQLRAALIALTEEFEAKHVAHEAALVPVKAVLSTLVLAMEDAQADLSAAESRAAEYLQLRDAIDAISHKINGFVEQAGASRESMSASTAALAAQSDRRRDAALAVSELKAARALGKKELAAVLEGRVAPAEKALQQAEAALNKLKALQKTLRAEAGLEVELEAASAAEAP